MSSSINCYAEKKEQKRLFHKADDNSQRGIVDYQMSLHNQNKPTNPFAWLHRCTSYSWKSDHFACTYPSLSFTGQTERTVQW